MSLKWTRLEYSRVFVIYWSLGDSLHNPWFITFFYATTNKIKPSLNVVLESQPIFPTSLIR